VSGLGSNNFLRREHSSEEDKVGNFWRRHKRDRASVLFSFHFKINSAVVTLTYIVCCKNLTDVKIMNADTT